MANMRTAKVKSKKIKTAKSAASPLDASANLVPPSAIGSAISASGQVPSANIVAPSPVPQANLTQQIDQIEMAKAAVMPAPAVAPAPAVVLSDMGKQMAANQAAFKRAKVKKVKKGQ